MKRKYESVFYCFLKTEIENNMPITRCIIQSFTGIRVPIQKKIEKQKEFNIVRSPPPSGGGSIEKDTKG